MKIFVFQIFLFLAITTAHAHDSRLAPEAEVLALVHGCVNVVTGEFVQQETDLFIDGPSLVHSRVYDSGNSNVHSALGAGFTWSIARQIRFLDEFKKRGKDDEGNRVDGGTTVISIEEREGVPLIYQGRHNGKPSGLDGQEYSVRSSTLSRGYTNYSPWGISGATSLHNVTPLHRNYKSGTEGTFTVTLGCGTKRIYNCVRARCWNLSQEIRPNGTKLFYDYDKDTLRKVWLTDAEETTPIASYSVTPTNRAIIVEGNNGQTIQYITDKNRTGYEAFWRLVQVEADHLPKTEYRYIEDRVTIPTLGKVTSITRPDGREVGIKYHETGRVRALYQPDSEKPLATFSYGGNYCKVVGASDEITRYIINPQRRISHIQHFSHLKLHHQSKYYWGTDGKSAGNLVAKALCDASGKALNSKYLIYDDFGNITRETLFGNLTGQGTSEFALTANGIPEGHVQGYATERSYLPVFNVITEEKGDDGSYTKYCYKEGTNLLIAKLQGRPRHIEREFFEYDKFANQIRHIVDDGSGSDSDDLTDVSVRTITEIDPITTPLSPAFGKPLTRREKYWECGSGREIPLRTIHYQYNDHGYPIQEDHHDAKGALRYSLHRVYDAAGRVLEETNPIGDKTTHSYDANGNRILTTLVEQKISFEYLYDKRNRLIKETEVHPNARYETTHCYDLSNRKTATVDAFGNETLYEHNQLGEITSVTHPQVNNIRGIEKFDYDLAGNKILVQDVLGGITRTTYTARGQPILVTYPDGSEEHSLYGGNGLLTQHTATNKVVTTLYYDSCQRPIVKQIAGENLSYCTRAKYKGTRIIKEVDANGIKTKYNYDGAGRLIETSKGVQRTTLSYDTLGRKCCSLEHIDDTTARATCWEYDLLNRITEERVEEYSLITKQSSLISSNKFTYDQYGNCCLHLSETSQGIARTQTDYDSRHRPVRVTDALGNITVTEYDEDLTHGILTTTVTDALGNQTITTQNSVGQVTEQLRKDILGITRAHSTFTYDLAGHKTGQCDTAMAPNLPDRKIVTEWVYDAMGRVTILTEAKDTPEQKTTVYGFNSLGQKESICLPDGTILLHTYDGLGRLQRYYASDNSFDYTYEYDLNNNLLNVADALTQTMTQRLYDDNNRIICETLANGLSLEYSYDALNRPLQVTLPDASKITYNYTAGHLKTVSRNGYEHQYTSYDLSGVLLEENTPIGKISYSWDLLNRPCTIESSYFSETIPETGYDAVGNLLHKSRQDPERLTHCAYSYDPLYQLKSETITGFDAHEYTYDSLYNRRLRDNKEHTVNHLNQLLQLEETTYTYDKRGHLIAEDSPTNHSEYTYDALGRLTSLSRNGNQYTYQYDAFNRRIAKRSPRSVERYLYIDQNEIGMVDDQNRIVQLRILGRGKGAEIGAAVALELEDSTYIPIHDHCGHVSVLIDLQAKQFAEGYVYSAFGEQQRYGSGTTNPWHFSSKRYDPESGWVYFGRRYYDPTTGRWTTPDPIGFADGPNLYAYVKNSPLTHFDAYGLLGAGTGSSSLYDTNRANRSTKPLSREPSGPSWWDRAVDKGRRVFGNPRVQGGLQAVGGLFETGVGATLALGTSGLGTWGGCAVMAHGMDHFIAGMNTLFSGEAKETMTSQGLQTAGIPPEAAHLIDGGLSMVATMGGAAAIQSSRTATPILKTLTTTTIVEETQVANNLNRFHYAAKNLSETGQTNIRILRSWAKSKGWQRLPNSQGGPEIWGITKLGKFEFRLKIKPESSLRTGLDSGSQIPRFDARLSEGAYVNPFTGEVGNSKIGTHNPLEYQFYE